MYSTYLLADNQDITRIGVQCLIQKHLECERCMDINNKQGLIAALSQWQESVVVLDYTLFDILGIEGLQILVSRFPSSRWILFSDELTEDFIRSLLIYNQISVVLKNCSEEEIHTALLYAARGDRYLCSQVSNMLLCRRDEIGGCSKNLLSPTETEILKLFAQGLSAKEVAAKRNSSIHTIITHKKNIFHKINVNTTYEATKYAFRAGLLDTTEYYI